MKVISIDKTLVKQELKKCPKQVRDYVKALENEVERKSELINKALAKIKELSKQSSITAVVQAKPENCDHEKWHLRSINAMSYRICDKCGAAL